MKLIARPKVFNLSAGDEISLDEGKTYQIVKAVVFDPISDISVFLVGGGCLWIPYPRDIAAEVHFEGERAEA